MVQMMISLTYMNAIKLFYVSAELLTQVQEFKEFKSDEHTSNDVCSHQFSDSNVEYLRANLNIKGMSNSRRTSLSNVDYMLYPSLLRTVTDWKGKPSLRSTERSLLHDNIVPKPDLALELGKSISLTEAEEEVVAREVHATHARIVYESEPEPTQRRQSGIAFRDSFIVSKKRSSDSSKKLKGIQTLTPAEQEAADIMKALKESKKMSKRQPGTGGLNEGTVTSTPPVIAPFTDVSSIKPSSLTGPSGLSPPINTEATTITTSLPEITPFIALQLRVARLEQEMSKSRRLITR
ncbi:hypothetical protein Tco_0725622 [Tanacetum coccineum]|uniref:Uncharacterized protein n=1 Tax=Tanacetum coccineum TaxID=301880 RepID=A0ABQ4YE92_9ASTR